MAYGPGSLGSLVGQVDQLGGVFGKNVFFTVVANFLFRHC